MLGYIKGRIKSIKEKKVLITSDNIGYWVYVPQYIIQKYKTGDELSLYTYQQISIKNESIDMYGFEKEDEIELFESFISISGVGPKSALAALSIAPIDQIKQTIKHGDSNLLQKVAGIGKKTAERIIIELKDRINLEQDAYNYSDLNNVIDVLKQLGYKKYEIQRVLAKVPKNLSSDEEIIKFALNMLSNKNP